MNNIVKNRLLGLVLLVTVVLGNRVFAQSTTDAVPVQIIAPADPTFDRQVEFEYPGLTRLQLYASIRPFLVLLRNTSSSRVPGYAVAWDVTVASGATRTLSTGFIRDPLDQRHDHSLNAGDVRLISPVFNLSPTEYGQSQYFSESYPAAIYPHFGDTVSVAPSLDGVVSEGKYYGPDRTHFVLQFRVFRAAEHDEVLSILKFLRDNPTAPTSSLIAKIRADAFQKHDASDNAKDRPALSRYKTVRAVHAARFVSMLQHRGQENFAKSLQIFASSKAFGGNLPYRFDASYGAASLQP